MIIHEGFQMWIATGLIVPAVMAAFVAAAYLVAYLARFGVVVRAVGTIAIVLVLLAGCAGLRAAARVDASRGCVAAGCELPRLGE